MECSSERCDGDMFRPQTCKPDSTLALQILMWGSFLLHCPGKLNCLELLLFNNETSDSVLKR